MEVDETHPLGRFWSVVFEVFVPTFMPMLFVARNRDYGCAGSRWRALLVDDVCASSRHVVLHWIFAWVGNGKVDAWLQIVEREVVELAKGENHPPHPCRETVDQFFRH